MVKVGFWLFKDPIIFVNSSLCHSPSFNYFPFLTDRAKYLQENFWCQKHLQPWQNRGRRISFSKMAKSYLVRNGQCLTECIDPVYKDSQSDEIAQSQDLLIINVGGMPFKVLKSNFSTLPRTRLSRLVRAVSSQEILALCDGYTPGPLPEFYFNRNWTSFNSILDFYRMGTLHLTVDTCAMVFKEDLAFWGIDELYLDPCCALKYYPEIEACFKEFKGDQMARKRDEDRKKYENFGDSHIGRIRGTLWRITEYPETSLAAQVQKKKKLTFLKLIKYA